MPAGAVIGAAPRITAQVLTDAAASPLLAQAVGAGLVPVSGAVQLTLTGGEFTAPVQMTLHFDPVKVVAGQAPYVFVYNERTGRWIYLGGEITAAGEIVITVDRFSQFAVFAMPPARVLTDIDTHWGRNNIRTLAGMGVIAGFPDATFKPNANITTRAEFVAMIVRALGLEHDAAATDTFEDAAGFGWSQSAIGAAHKAGLVSGYADSTFGAARQITRAEVAVILARVRDEKLVRLFL